MNQQQKVDYTIRPASWQEDREALMAIRECVFMREQSVPAELEWDGEDETALHLLATDNSDRPLGTARMLADGHIGRVAVLSRCRHQGIGRALMLRLLQEARRQGHRRVFLDAQVGALGFYERLGFVAEGDIFMDAGIPHRHMQLVLAT